MVLYFNGLNQDHMEGLLKQTPEFYTQEFLLH